ncbi:hypothetical protein [Streptomyces sp. A475]|uniref:hypothetical protein n=1 Tax=Streptomyces sp. A475 TaxID=3131976 RepID=UPI004040B009
MSPSAEGDVDAPGDQSFRHARSCGTDHEDAGFAALHDVTPLSAMYGSVAGAAHAFALYGARPWQRG